MSQTLSHPSNDSIITPPRDLRVDFFRGAALLIIFIDHVETKTQVTLFSRYTLKAFGFCDGAEVFIFLSGYVFGLVYNRIYQRDGFADCQRKALRRCGELYLANLLTLCITLAFVVPISLSDAEIASRFYLHPLLQSPFQASIYILDLMYVPYAFGILRLYILFLLVMPALLFLLRWKAPVAWLISFGVYLATQFWNWFDIPVFFVDPSRFYFNPLSWQFLFFVGLAIGANNSNRIHTATRSGFLTFVCLIGIIGALCANRIIPDLVQHGILTDPKWLELLAGLHPMIRKATLAPIRLIHFLLLAYIVRAVSSPSAWFWRSRWAMPLVVCGQHSLPVFCLGLFLMYVAAAVVIWLRLGTAWVAAVDIVGCALLITTAWSLDGYTSANTNKST